MVSLHAGETDVPVILAVDDEPLMTSLEKTLLENAGFRVVTATSGREAIRKAFTISPDLVLLDINLPDIDGILVCQHIRKSLPVPVLEVSGRWVRPEERATGLEEGADDYLTKPFKPRLLVAKVKALLRRAGTIPPDGWNDARHVGSSPR